jgi:hypothetical protein
MNIPRSIAAALLTAFVFFGCAQKSDPNAALERSCDNGRDSISCLKLGQAWLTAKEPSLELALEREVRLRKYQARWDGDAFLALHGAWLTRTGGAYAASGDVIKAVDAVDAGLSELEFGHVRFPHSTTLRLTHALTLSHLPSVFKKREAARDSLTALERQATLTSHERTLVTQALDRLKTAKD